MKSAAACRPLLRSSVSLTSLQARLGFAAEGLLVPLLAMDAANGRRRRLEALEADVVAAVDAHAVGALRKAIARRLERAELVQVARHVGLLEIGDQRRHRLVARIGRGPGVLRVWLLARARRVFAQLRNERPPARLDHAA